jgi:hypothetical protein
MRNPGDTHCPICGNSYSERKGQDCPEVHDPINFDVDPEKFQKLADEMDDQWARMQADPRVQAVMSDWAEVLNSEDPEPT